MNRTKIFAILSLVVAITLFLKFQKAPSVGVSDGVPEAVTAAGGSSTAAKSKVAAAGLGPATKSLELNDENFPNQLKGLREKLGVRSLLTAVNRDGEALTDKLTPEQRQELTKGAVSILTELGPCLVTQKECGFNKSEWQDYYTIGGPQAFYILERALNFLTSEGMRTLPDGLSQDLLLQLMQSRVQSTSLAAASLAYQVSSTDAETKQTYLQSLKVPPPTLPLMYELALKQSAVHNSQQFQSDIESHIAGEFRAGNSDRSDEILPQLSRLQISPKTAAKIGSSICGASARKSSGDFSERRVFAYKKQMQKLGYTDLENSCR